MENSQAFQCRRCGQCCYGYGGVRLNKGEAQKAADYLKISLAAFSALYLASENAAEKNIKTGDDGFCIFHQDSGLCLIHPVKPFVCRLWPFLPGPLSDQSAYNDAVACCSGLNKCLSWEFFKQAYKRQWNKIGEN